MIHYGLKLWTNNTDLFEEALKLHSNGQIDFIELLANPAIPHDFDALARLKTVPVTIHATNTAGFHTFIIEDREKEIWGDVLKLADFFGSDVIVLHPGQDHTVASFEENLKCIDDSRIYLENMAGIDVNGGPMFGQRLDDLIVMSRLKPFCFDFEKAVKAARYQSLDYKKYTSDCLEILTPTYFHISGGDAHNPMDQHLDLSASNFDMQWMKNEIQKRDGRLVFETPKKNGLANDMVNMEYFRNL